MLWEKQCAKRNPTTMSPFQGKKRMMIGVKHGDSVLWVQGQTTVQQISQTSHQPAIFRIGLESTSSCGIKEIWLHISLSKIMIEWLNEWVTDYKRGWWGWWGRAGQGVRTLDPFITEATSWHGSQILTMRRCETPVNTNMNMQRGNVSEECSVVQCSVVQCSVV